MLCLKGLSGDPLLLNSVYETDALDDIRHPISTVQPSPLTWALKHKRNNMVISVARDTHPLVLAVRSLHIRHRSSPYRRCWIRRELPVSWVCFYS